MITIESVTMTPSVVNTNQAFYISIQVTDNNKNLWLIDSIGNFLKDKLGNFLKVRG